MPYSTPNEVRVRAVGMTAEVIPDVSSSSLNLTVCIAEADAEIDEAGRAGDYEAPFGPAPTRIQQLSAVGALARARRALEMGDPADDPYRREFEAGLQMLRTGRLDLGTVVVSGESVVMPREEGDWAQLAHRGVLARSVVVTDQSGGFTYVEDRSAYEPGYRPDAIKDYLVDHREGRATWLTGGRIALGQTVLARYEYYYRQPGRAQDAEYGRRSAGSDVIVRAERA